MEKIIICKICNTEFKSTSPRPPVYCSDKCRKIGKNANHRAWEEKNPDYMRLYMRSYKSPSQIRAEKEREEARRRHAETMRENIEARERGKYVRILENI